jgi:hypothetical protein
MFTKFFLHRLKGESSLLLKLQAGLYKRTITRLLETNLSTI